MIKSIIYFYGIDHSLILSNDFGVEIHIYVHKNSIVEIEVFGPKFLSFNKIYREGIIFYGEIPGSLSKKSYLIKNNSRYPMLKKEAFDSAIKSILNLETFQEVPRFDKIKNELRLIWDKMKSGIIPSKVDVGGYTITYINSKNKNKNIGFCVYETSTQHSSVYVIKREGIKSSSNNTLGYVFSETAFTNLIGIYE